ncbi:M50 family metallopeptidase [Micropruina sonneratiae]|uniref:M50 family metallopeptidase n=1 Tax=Micropruina sonneratiae TaxID=2986940 RepID=UPI0022265AC7|nr:site-2 protease family protein [Micropruina sp. KQZ13P-5]MCW3157244.1 site-2 protease family protein [Micropruina sp. KQZ13P-5]
MNTVVTIVFAIVFFGCIMVSIALHEIGHMVPAKAFGVRVPQYFVGFGPTIWSTVRGETEYGVKWIPLGGFVRLLGMYPPARAGRAGNRLTRFADAAREYEWSEITPTDVSGNRLFYQKRTWQKLVVMAGGPAMNVLIAFVLFWSIIGLHGTWVPQPVVAEVQPCIIRENQPTTQCFVPDTPAAKSGIRAGDRIVEFNGVAITDYGQLVDLIRANLDGPARLVVERDGVRVPLTEVDTVVSGVQDELDPSVRIPAGWFGITPTSELVKGGPVEVVQQMWTMTEQSVVAIAKFPVKVYNVLADLVQGKPRDIYGPLSIVGASRAAGEVVASDDLQVTDKLVLFGSLLGAINLFLALFNFVPLPPLDGGHIAGALWEAIRRGWAKLFRRPDPGHFDTAMLLPVAYAVGGFLILSGVVLIVADVVSPMQLF